jgi:4-hydroxy-tetrahydrodipicolinate synthase
LSPDEWETLISIAIEEAQGKIPVTAGCGTNSTATTVARVERAVELGAQAALIVLPYYNKPNPAGHLAHMQAACDVGLPIVAYHVPGRTAQHLSAGLLAEICELQGVIALKEATGDLQLASELLETTSTTMLSGDDATALPFLALGGHGMISVLSNVDPWATVALYQAQGEEARALHYDLMPLVRYLFSQSNPIPCKAAMSALGLCQNRLRLPLTSCEPPPPALLASVPR